ncbi:MAG: pectate lyase [Fibrobacter sp.]|nr:pectate lyase [Fibrobacter sp.]
MGIKGFLTKSAVVWNFGISAVFAAVPATEVVNLPTEAAYGGGDKVGSQLVAATYNAGGGPGIWIVADGGYRLYHNGALLAEDNQAGRVRFIPMTFLPGENAISVVGVNGSGAPGVMVQIDDLDKSYYSGSEWKSKPTVGNSAWKNKGRDLSQWGGATTLSYANSKMPSGGALNGFAANTQAKWIWTSDEADPTAVLLYTFYVKAEGFGASTTGGDAGSIVVASDTATIRKYMQSSDAVTILVPEGTYDFRKFVDAATSAANSGWTWCKSSCAGNVNANNTFYRISFTQNSCSGLSESTTMVKSGEIDSWSNWMTVKGNKSLVGMGRGANMRGASWANRSYEGAHNNIYRNLALYDVNPHLIEGGDGLEVSGSGGKEVENMWFDHISYKWISDGMDLEYVKGITVSYLDYDGSNEYNCYYYDPYMHLVETAQLTFANVYWHNGFGRVPKVTSEADGSYASTVHIYNSYVDYNHWHVIDASGKSGKTTQILYENNYVKDPQIQIAGKDAYSKINFKNTTVAGAKNSKPYNNDGTSQSAAFTDNVFAPSYSYVLRSNSSLPTEIPKLAGVGGRYGKMPEYNQAFGQSNKAATVSLTAPAANAKFDSGDNITLSATAKDNDGTVKNVAFYVGNTLVGSATAAPYQVTVSGVEPGLHSAVAVVTDNSGLTQMSEFIAFTVEGATSPEVVKCGAGPSKQDDLTLGDAIVDFCYTWSGAETVVATGFPKGIVTDIDNANRKISISGTPSEAGVFEFTVSASANGETFTKTGRMTITDPNAPSSGESSGASFTTGESTQSVAFSARNATAGKTAYYRIFDMQGRPLFAGHQKPAKMPAARVIVVEYTTAGTLKRRYVR